MKKNEILHLADAYGYNVVDVRPSSDSFLTSSRTAVVGFKDFETAQMFAEEYDMRVHQILKYDNVDMWVNEGLAISEIDTLEVYKDYGYSIVEPGEFSSERDFYEDFALKHLSDCQNFSEACETIRFTQGVWNLYKGISDGELVIAELGNTQKVDRFSMKHHFNGATRQIACIPKLI